MNFGASKLSVTGNVTIEDLEAAGAFDGIKVFPAAERRMEPNHSISQAKRKYSLGIITCFLTSGVLLSFRYSETYPAAIALFAVSIAIGGAGMFKIGFKNLARFEFDMKTLMTIAIIGAVIIGEWREGAVIVFFFAVSEALEAYSMNKARQSIRSLMDIAPPSATVRRGGELTGTC